MVPDPSPTADASTDDGYSTLVSAVVGAVVGILLSWVPLSPLLGGAVAGYLEGGDPTDGATVGGIAGALMLVPLAFAGAALLFFLGIGFGLGHGGPTVAFGALALAALFLGAAYTVGLGAVGGYLVVYLADEL